MAIFQSRNRGKNYTCDGERKKIAEATRTLLKARAPCVIVSLSPFPYLPRTIARFYLIKRFARDRELLLRFVCQIKRSCLNGTVRQTEKKMLTLVAMHFASPNGNRRQYLLCSLHMRIKNLEYKLSVFFCRRVVLLVPCLELINDYSYGPLYRASQRFLAISLCARIPRPNQNLYFSLRNSHQKKIVLKLFADTVDEIKCRKKSETLYVFE